MENEVKQCPCGSGKHYQDCCQPFHAGQVPPDALTLMRSRYAAYALNLPDYIIKTTHPASPQYSDDYSRWAKKLSSFSQHCKFEKLEVLDFKEQRDVATVTFVAHLSQNGQDATFTEKSYFDKVNGKWMYRIGQLAEGRVPNLITTGQIKILPLAYYGNPILRKKGDPILEISEEIETLVDDMIETMDGCDGIGLAAPQVHQSIQLFIIREPTENESGEIVWGDVKVFINPVLSAFSEDKWISSEGCLSIPSIHLDVERSKEVTVDYTNLDGERVQERCSGMKARVIMHEYDHLQGVLFIDHLSAAEKEKIDPFLKRLHHRIHDGTEL
jgi:peptide deformylase